MQDWGWKKTALVGGAVLGGGILLTALLWPRPKKTKKPNLGLTVGPQCSNYTITDPLVLRNKLREEVGRKARLNQVDPFSITSAFLTQKALACVSYPNKTRNPGEAMLFYTIFKIVMSIMVDENKISQDGRETFELMASLWALSNGAVIEEGHAIEENNDGLVEGSPQV